MAKIILFLNCLIVAITGFSQAENSVVVDANAMEFHKFIDSCNNELIIDVQTVAEFRKEALAGSVNAPTKNDLLTLTDTLDRDTPILIYCTEGLRSLQASQLLLKNSFTLVVNLKYGLTDWTKNGYKVVNRIKKQ